MPALPRIRRERRGGCPATSGKGQKKSTTPLDWTSGAFDACKRLRGRTHSERDLTPNHPQRNTPAKQLENERAEAGESGEEDLIVANTPDTPIRSRLRRVEGDMLLEEAKNRPAAPLQDRGISKGVRNVSDTFKARKKIHV